MSKKDYGPNTRLVHSGPNPLDSEGFVNPAVVHGSTVLFPDYDTFINRSQKYVYGTMGTPTTDALTDCLSELEGAAGTFLYPSGLVAITSALLSVVKSGDHILLTDSIYFPTRRFANLLLEPFGVEVEYYAPNEGGAIASRLRDNTAVVFTESPASNTFEMQDIPAIVEVAKQANAAVMMDNTWASPLNYQPIKHGVDVSIQALTKYPGGHSDLIMGSVAMSEELYERMLPMKFVLGQCVSGDDAYLVLRGLRTLGIRLERHGTSALQIATWLEQQPWVERVLFPPLPSDPGHQLWKRDFSGVSGLMGVVTKSTELSKVAAFLEALELFGLGYSWGGFESLAITANIADRALDPQLPAGTLLRISIGLEDPEDLIMDLDRASSQLS